MSRLFGNFKTQFSRIVRVVRWVKEGRCGIQFHGHFYLDMHQTFVDR